jgi:hypothetical protein
MKLYSLVTLTWRFVVNELLSPEKRPRLEIFKVAAGASKQFIILGEQPITFTAHFRQRTLYCAGGDCPWCEEGLRRQWRGYIAAARPESTAGAIELSAEAWDKWETIRATRSLPGLIVSISRRTENAPAYPEVLRQGDLSRWGLVDRSTLRDSLCRLLRIPERSQYPTEDAWTYAVGCVYRQERDAAPIFRLARGAPPLARKNLA